MKLLYLTVHFEYADVIEQILDRNGISDLARYPMIEGKDCDGKHFGTQVYPGSVTAIHEQVQEDAIDGRFAELQTFREEKHAHQHLQAIIVPVE